MAKLSKREKELSILKEFLSPPGDTILETMEFKKLTIGHLVNSTTLSEAMVSGLIAGTEPITISIAIQLEKALGIDMQFWINRETRYRQKLYDISILEEKLKNPK